MSIVRDAGLAEAGKTKIAWARSFMPALGEVEKIFAREKPLAGQAIAMSIHLEAKTACLALVLQEGGAEVFVTGSNPLSTQDDVAAGLASMGAEVFAFHGCTEAEYTEHLAHTLVCRPTLILDDGGDLTELLHGGKADCRDRMLGGTEETTTGVHRLYGRAQAGKLVFPMMAVNDARCKHMFDNRFGTGQSVWDALMHTTNVLVAGKTVVVAGYGWCGRGVAARAAGLGARVIVTEVDAVKALEAVMDGYTVLPMDEAAARGDIFVTVTGCSQVITQRHFARMKHEVILANAGHFDVEIDMKALRETAAKAFARRPNVMGYAQKDGRVLNVVGEGRLVNLAAGNGHPIEIMDMSFAVQALSLRYMLENAAAMQPGVYPVPPVIDEQVAQTKLQAIGVAKDSLTEAQKAYLQSF